MEIQSVKQRFGIVGNDEALDRAFEIALKVAATDLTVLVSGPSGVGKEYFPQIIHSYSSRKHNKYIAVNCGAIPEGTIESELFGHQSGAFTGANNARKGYFEEADGGTIFLDEVGELPLAAQVRLLRILQTGEYMRVGASTVQKVNVRVVAATNIDLLAAVQSGKFREDLFYRLNTVPIQVPALRDRGSDVGLLFRKFASDISEKYRMPAISLDEQAKKMLLEYSWPGNVRQLKNVAEQISVIEEARSITPEILSKYLPVTENKPMVIGGDKRGSEQMADEREILYKVLFDLRADMNELKRMVAELKQPAPVYDNKEIAGYLSPNAGPSFPPPGHPASFAEPEYATEVSEEPSRKLTKEEVMRENILKALRRHNGKRKEAARDLFISERTLYRKIKELDINEY